MNSYNKVASLSYDMLEKSILAIDEADVLDIYVISFFVYDESDDPRCPTLTLGYNDNASYEDGISDPSDTAEAKWNYAFWFQNELCKIGEMRSPSESALQEWIQDLGLMYTEDEWDEDTSRCIEFGRAITKQFVDLAVELAKQLHANGVIERKFKRPIPIIIHEYEYYDEIAEQCKRANPEGLIDEFVSWIDSM